MKKLDLEKYAVNFIKLSKDWRFIFKVITFLIFFISILVGFIYAVFIDFWYVSPKDMLGGYYLRLYNLNVLISFWSVQTNVLAGLWFLYAIFYHNREKENKFTNINSQIYITIYITVTFLIFWGIIVTNVFENAVYDFKTRTWSDLIITSITHLITPLLAIIFLIFSLGEQKFSYKNYIFKKSFIMLIYPVSYLIFVIIRAEMIIRDKIGIMISPYPFVDFYDPILNISRVWNNIILIVFWICLLITFLIMYVAINNIIYKFKLKRNLVRN